ncbi:hypothetical protein M8Z33_28715 [Streptomyces sp. ZAF1911]|uniref:hypothetical protein n=1 Tax=Streptomyces sp. ZAF1911 TaxID=2944129 RepID=UPI00237C013B|nr:hypothetical protein [Streptomyces sp. ZAF1911]MDD9380567.1 hypothetical protein [Streptomyces sp. ZAF1911]
MQPVHTLHRACAAVAGTVAVLLLACVGLFTHPASAMAAMPTPPALAGLPGSPATAGTPAPAGMAMGAGPATRLDQPVLGAVAPGGGGGCSGAGQECPLVSAYAPTVAAGPVGEVSGFVAGGAQAAGGGRPGGVPPPECARPRAPDLDSLCVSRT